MPSAKKIIKPSHDYGDVSDNKKVGEPEDVNLSHPVEEEWENRNYIEQQLSGQNHLVKQPSREQDSVGCQQHHKRNRY